MLLFADGFDAYGATADLTKKWASTTSAANITWGAAAGRFGGGGLMLGNGAGSLYSPVLNGTLANYTGFSMYAFWFKASAKPSGVFAFLASGPTINAANQVLAVNTNGQIGMSVQGAANLTYPTVNVCDGQWHWIEAQLGFAVSGSRPATLVVDGVTVLSFNPNLGSNNGPFQLLTMSAVAAGITITIDDLLAWDDQAGLQTGELAAASFPIGAKKCETQWPNGAGTNTNWSPLSGANYANVNENPSDWDTSYVQASVSGVRDSYAFPGSIGGINPLVAVVNCVAKNADAGSINIQGLTYSGSSYGLGDSKTAGSAYTTMQFPLYRDPNTGAAWTKAGVNAAQFGVGVV